MSETDPLIQVDELRALLSDAAPPTVVDLRWGGQGPTPARRYLDGHLPGAVRADLDADLAAPPGTGGRHPLPDPETFLAAMRRLGVDRDRPVVVYDQRDATISARLWWMLRDYGHPAVRVLDGGYEAWVRAGAPVGTGPGAPVAPGGFTGTPGAMPLLTVDEVPDAAARGFLLDSRLPERFRGEVEPLDPVAGHIPGALSAPTFDNSAPDGRFRSPEELRSRFSGLGLTHDRPVAAYCGSGVTAAHQVLALRLAGFDAALYAGSWSEWIADPDRPVAVGA
ncbi:sulfurtransferase [Streptomyces sp. NPDC005775]|uniref:sulfurtransferase n=1 Tax=unclassified Streptomyces TaxID=2593676 RepID=UPI0033E5BB11